MAQTRYTYFVFYQYQLPDGIGFGNCDIFTKQEITDIRHVRELEKEIQRRIGVKNVAISSYQLMSRETA